MIAGQGKANPKRGRGKKPTPESLVVNACLRWLFWKKCFAWRNNTGAHKTEEGRFIRFGLPGSADIIGMLPAHSALPGVFLAVECKATTDLTMAQEEFRDEVLKSGGVYIVARSVDDLEKQLKGVV